MFAIVDAHQKGHLHLKHWRPNILAGLTVGIVALPLAMAFAIATGAKPEQGLYTAIISSILVGLFGGSQVQIAGPTGAFIVILSSITAQYGIEGLQTATLLAGMMLFLMGVLRLGSIIKFIPEAVIVGFTTGIGFIIFIGEFKDFFGLPIHLALNAHFSEKLWVTLSAMPQLNPATTIMALISLLIVVYSPKIYKPLPGPLAAMAAATLLQMIFQFKSVATMGSLFGGIPQQLPSFHLPNLSPNYAMTLLAPAFSIALLGAIESLLSAATADKMAGTRHHSNHELVGQGLANMMVPLFGGFAATGAIARTATNVRNGGHSCIAAMTHALFLILVILLFAPLAANIPLYVLAAILCVVAFNMSDLPHFFRIIKTAPRTEILVLLTTCALTIFSDLIIAVTIGTLPSLVFYVQKQYMAGIDSRSMS